MILHSIGDFSSYFYYMLPTEFSKQVSKHVRCHTIEATQDWIWKAGVFVVPDIEEALDVGDIFVLSILSYFRR